MVKMIKVNEEVHKRAKVAAALAGVPLSSWVEAAIVEKLQRPTPKPGKAKA